MSSMSRVADIAQRAVTTSLLAWLGFQCYQIGTKINEGWVRKKETGFFEEIKKKQIEDAATDGRIDVLKDYYTEENQDEYKKTIPRFNITEKQVPK